MKNHPEIPEEAIYVDGQLWYTDTLGGQLVTPTGVSVYIGCQNGLGQLFSGYINTVRVWGSVMTSDQVTANYLLGPWTLPDAPKVITFAAISNVTLNSGVTLNVTNSATDPDQPPLPLTFSILAGPSNATINASSGLFAWRTAVVQANSTNTITLKVQNNASPGLSATQRFVATVNPVSTPSIMNALFANGSFGFQITGDVGPDYLIQSSTNLLDWFTVFGTNPAAMPVNWIDTNILGEPARFYRVQVGP